MAQESLRHPRFLFTIDQIGQNPACNSRYKDGIWQPPRPLRSNIVRQSPTTGKVYEYHHGNIQIVSRPTSGWLHYRTYSFYYSQGNIFLHPTDATRGQIADGSGNSRRGSSVQATADSSDESDDDDPSTWDWRPLSFTFPVGDDPSLTSFIGFRRNTRHMAVVRYEQQHMQAIRELLPDTYLNDAQRIASTANVSGVPCGGLVGEIPVLIALVAFSVPPAQVEAALRGHLRHAYLPQGAQRGLGWTDRRGLVVRVLCEVDTGIQALSPTEILRTFELGRLPGYGKFVA